MPLYWGDFHCHIQAQDRIEPTFAAARENLDFYPAVCYPWKHAPIGGGFVMENCGYSPDLERLWPAVCHAVQAHNDPGRFVTFPGFEWHGDPAYGDHNIFFPVDNPPLPRGWTLPEVYDEIRPLNGIAIPHHTGYLPRHRGKDWNCHDAALSPVTEIYSGHGSSEGFLGPLSLDENYGMGPGCTGGTLMDVKKKKKRVSVQEKGSASSPPARVQHTPAPSVAAGSQGSGRKN